MPDHIIPLLDYAQDELYNLATECDSENGPGHCRACEAWGIWVGRDQESKRAEIAAVPTEAEAVRALQLLLAELPHEFCLDPETDLIDRESFQVIKRSNTRKVHRHLWTLQKYLGV